MKRKKNTKQKKRTPQQTNNTQIEIISKTFTEDGEKMIVAFPLKYYQRELKFSGCIFCHQDIILFEFLHFQITALKIKHNPFAKAFLDAKER